MKITLQFAEINKARAFVKHVEKVITSVQGYHYFRDSKRITTDPVQMWPASLDALVTDYNSRYWIACSIAEAQAGKCKRPEYTPFGSKVSYMVKNADTTQLLIPTGRLGENRTRWNTALLQIPFAKQNASGDIEISIYPPMNSTAYNEFIRKDGSTKLTAPWDAGNQPITNVAGMSIRNDDGSQMPIGGVMTVINAKHLDHVQKPKCPTYLKPAIQATPQGQFNTKEVLTLIGNNKVSITDFDNYWTVAMEYAAKLPNEEKFKLRNDGVISVVTYCLPIK